MLFKMADNPDDETLICAISEKLHICLCSFNLFAGQKPTLTVFHHVHDAGRL